MGVPIDSFDLAALRLTPGEGRRIEVDVAIEPFTLGADVYPVDPAVVAARLEFSRITGPGYALRLCFDATLRGPCMRCLEPAQATYHVDAREISVPGAGEELDSPYVEGGVLNVSAWARDALALTLPRAILCREECAGLCPVCASNLNQVGPEHHHESEPDPRWAKLSELRFD
jgi:uncharacterized protein